MPGGARRAEAGGGPRQNLRRAKTRGGRGRAEPSGGRVQRHRPPPFGGSGGGGVVAAAAATLTEATAWQGRANAAPSRVQPRLRHADAPNKRHGIPEG